MARFFGINLLLVLGASCVSRAQTTFPRYNPPDPSAGYVKTTSPEISKQQWTNLLGNLIWFYDAQRSGRLPASNRVPWRNDSAVQDAADGNDLSGGYYDAGDYIKATYPLSFTLFSVCWGANQYGGGYDSSQQTGHLDEMLRWGLDWMMKAHPNPDTLYIQVADTKLDNDYWGGDQGIPLPRPAWAVNRTLIGTEVVSMASSMFSVCSALYSGFGMAPQVSPPPSLVDSTYAAKLLTHASQLWSLAQQEPFRLHSDSIKNVVEWAYPGSQYTDDHVLAEVSIGLAIAASNSTSSSPTGQSPQQHLDKAVQLYKNYGLSTSKTDAAYNWASQAPAIPLMMAELAALKNSALQPQGGLDFWQNECEVYFDRIVDGKGRSYLTKGGLLWYPSDSDLASLNPAANAAMLMFMYTPFATSSSKGSAYRTFAQGQLDYFLGKNNMNVPYVVGMNPNSPKRPHDAKSHGGSGEKGINTDPVEAVHIIYGAVVGGPDKNDKYWDIRTDWPQTEIALDYNAPFLTLAAYSVMFGASTPPFFTSLAPGLYDSVRPNGTPCDPVFPCDSGMSSGSKIGMGIGIAIAVLVVLGLIGFLLWRRRRQAKA